MESQDVKFIEITRTYSVADLAMIKAVFDEAKVSYFVVDEFSGLLGGGEGYIVKVEESQAGLARELLQNDSTANATEPE